MSEGRIYVDGELLLPLETVAELYQVRAVWLREVCELGLLGGRFVGGSGLCIAAIELDRVATIVRLGQRWGLDLDVIAVLLSRS